jgi:hypothetical protein
LERSESECGLVGTPRPEPPKSELWREQYEKCGSKMAIDIARAAVRERPRPGNCGWRVIGGGGILARLSVLSRASRS